MEGYVSWLWWWLYNHGYVYVCMSVCVCVCVYIYIYESESISHSVMSDSLGPTKLLCPWNSSDKNTRVGSHSLLWGNLPNPGIKPGSPALQADLFCLNHQRSLYIWHFIPYVYRIKCHRAMNTHCTNSVSYFWYCTVLCKIDSLGETGQKVYRDFLYYLYNILWIYHYFKIKAFFKSHL